MNFKVTCILQKEPPMTQWFLKKGQIQMTKQLLKNSIFFLFKWKDNPSWHQEFDQNSNHLSYQASKGKRSKKSQNWAHNENPNTL